MKFKISKKINRIDLHDSTIEELVITPDFINLVFDWAKLQNFDEENLTSIIVGKCCLKLSGIRENKFELNKKLIDFPKNFSTDFDIITENYSVDDNHLKISGLYNTVNKPVWINWFIEFNDFEFSWNNYLTFDQWKNGESIK